MMEHLRLYYNKKNNLDVNNQILVGDGNIFLCVCRKHLIV